MFHEKAVYERDKKWKRAYLKNVNIAMWALLFTGKCRDNVSTAQKTETEVVKNEFLGVLCGIPHISPMDTLFSKENSYLFSSKQVFMKLS